MLKISEHANASHTRLVHPDRVYLPDSVSGRSRVTTGRGRMSISRHRDAEYHRWMPGYLMSHLRREEHSDYCIYAKSGVVFVQIVHYLSTLVLRDTPLVVDKERYLIFATQFDEFVVCLFVPGRPIMESGIMDHVRHPEVGEFLANRLAVRTPFCLVEF